LTQIRIAKQHFEFSPSPTFAKHSFGQTTKTMLLSTELSIKTEFLRASSPQKLSFDLSFDALAAYLFSVPLLSS
jgi:hypothetical protein